MSEAEAPAPTQAVTQTNTAAEADNSPSQPQKSPKPVEEMFELTVDGKPVKWTKAQALAYANKGMVADKRFEEAAAMKKQNERLLAMAKKNPIQALMDPELGLTKEQIREHVENWYNDEFIETEKLSPAELELRDYKAKLQKYEEQEKERKEREEREHEEQLTAKERSVLEKQIIEALEASGLPKTPFHAARMAFYMAENMRNGWDAPQEYIIETVRNEHEQFYKHIADLPAEEIIKTMGEDFINKIRAYDLKKLRESRGKITNPFSGEAIKKDVAPKKVSHLDVAENLRNLRRNGF